MHRAQQYSTYSVEMTGARQQQLLHIDDDEPLDDEVGADVPLLSQPTDVLPARGLQMGGRAQAPRPPANDAQHTSARWAPPPAPPLASPRQPSSILRGAHHMGGAGSHEERKKRVMARNATVKLMQLSTRYRSRQQLEEMDGALPPWVMHPLDVCMQHWNIAVLITVLLTVVVEPFFLAFAEFPGLYPATSFDSLVTMLLMCAYSLDIAVNFTVAYYDEEGRLVTDLGSIARHYAQWRLWVDLACTIPFDWIALAATGLQYSSTVEARSYSLLRLLRLGRAYRLKKWASYLATNASYSLTWVTVWRNSLLLFYVTHVAACLLYYIARQNEGAGPTWLLATSEWRAGIHDASAPALRRYCTSLYFATVTFATVGYGDLHAYSVPEAAFCVLYIYINVYIGAYVIGTITLLVTRADGETGRYRTELAALEQYGATHHIPQDLQSAMLDHLRLHHSAQEGSDEQVLAALPSALRRRVLRHLYLGLLTGSWLLAGCRKKFLDALLGAAKVEHFMPRVEIASEGDPINELMILVAGTCLVDMAPSSAPQRGPPSARAGEVVLDLSHPDGSWGGGPPPPSDQRSSPYSYRQQPRQQQQQYGGGARSLSPGDPIAEMAFFTETANLQAVRSAGGVVRVLCVPRTAYCALAAAFPLSVDALLGNLARASREMVDWEFPTAAAASGVLNSADRLRALAVKFASPEELEGGASAAANAGGGAPPAGGDAAGAAPAAGHGGPPLGPRQQRAVSNLLRVSELVAAQQQRMLRERTGELLQAAAQGGVGRVREMLQQGLAPDVADYDGRTALMTAARNGQVGVVELLLAAGADPGKMDKQQSCALLEAAHGGHDAAMGALMAAGAAVKLDQVAAASQLCSAVFRGDVTLLRRLLRAGLPADAADWDRRTPAHVAAAEGSLAALRVLVQEGGADPGAADRWGLTPLDEALRGGAGQVVEFLRGVLPAAVYEATRRRFLLHRQRAEPALPLAAPGAGDVRAPARISPAVPAPACTAAAAAGGDDDGGRGDGGASGRRRAAVRGLVEMVKLLAESGADLSCVAEYLESLRGTLPHGVGGEARERRPAAAGGAGGGGPQDKEPPLAGGGNGGGGGGGGPL